MTDWNIEQARQTYNIQEWSEGYFAIGEDGHVLARPSRDPRHPNVDLYKLADELHAAGMSLPVLVRFVDILHDRIRALREAFNDAMAQHRYSGRYTAVYPIKVNQQRRVVEEILRDSDDGVGLEAGSKPELMAVLAMSRPGRTVICNGYKDREYVRLALWGQKLGLDVHIVVEKLSEVALVLAEAEALNVQPQMGMRVRLASIGKGKWQNTGGEKSKFGLTASQALAVVERLQQADKLACLNLLHFHLGSQIPHIRDIQRGLREAGRFFAELRSLGAPVGTVDVGGGLGVDYEGTRSRSYCSMNYSVGEYATQVVRAFAEICGEYQLDHPRIITESGRAMTAHHAVLLTNVIDQDRVSEIDEAEAPAAQDPVILHDLWQALENAERHPPVEVYHDVAHWLAEAQSMFTHGVLNLAQRAHTERLYQATCRRILPRLDPRVRAHRELLDELNEKLADKLFCNFSIFQSMPDIWAIDQIFPVLPLHRLDEPPTRRSVLQDLTCDSDGCINGYVDRDGVESTLPLPAYKPGEPYLLGVFMVGAYQEILGDMHNLFGDTDAINVELTDGGYRLSDPVRGDNVSAVLRYVHFETGNLLAAYQSLVDTSPLSEDVRLTCLRELEAGLQGYTYLED